MNDSAHTSEIKSTGLGNELYVGGGRRERGVKGEPIFLVGVESGWGFHLLRHGTLEGETFWVKSSLG